MIETVAKLAGMAQKLAQQLSQCEELRRLLEPLARLGFHPVDGERLFLDKLERLVSDGTAIIADISSTTDPNAVVDHLDRLESAVGDVSWDVAREIIDDLRGRLREQETLIISYRAKFEEWRRYLHELNGELGAARSEGIPLLLEERVRQEIDALVEQGERGLRDGFGLQIAPLIERIETTMPDAKAQAETIAEKLKEGRRHVRQADLLLLRSPLDHTRNLYKYTVLLRTPSRPGSHGVNIQGSSSVGRADRDRMTKLYKKLTSAVNQTIVRKARIQSPPTVADTQRDLIATSGSSAADLPATNSAESTLRFLFLDDDAAGEHVMHDANALLRQAGDFMFRVFIPEQMKDFLFRNPCSLTLTTNDLELPWELMFLGDEFLCRERPVARLPMGVSFPRVHNRVAEPRGRKKRFLLIYADPYGNLPAAASEIDIIKEQLQKGHEKDIEFKVLYGKEATSDELNAILCTDHYDVIHYAGHAIFDPKHPELSGLFLEGEEIFLAEKIRRLLGGAPLVFLNACQSAQVSKQSNEEHLPSVTYELSEAAEGVASAFIYGGALGCIGAIWPVHDRPAADFAVHFYNKVLEGETIGEAMRFARIEISKNHPDQITWASFALYGDPTLRVFT